MKPLSSESVDELTIEALESVAFVLGAALEEHDHSYDRHSLIHFSGPDEESELSISVTDDFLRDLTCNMLGVAPTAVDLNRDGDAALRELANIICGEIVQALGGITRRFILGLPASVQHQPKFHGCEQLIQSTIESNSGTIRISVARSSC